MRTLQITLFPRSKRLLQENERLQLMVNELASANKALGDDLDATKDRCGRLANKLNDASFRLEVAKGTYANGAKL